DRAGFVENEGGWGNMGRFEVEVEERVQTGGGEGGEMEGRGGLCGRWGGFWEKVFENREIVVDDGLVEKREAGRDEGGVQVNGGRNTDRGVVEEGGFGGGRGGGRLRGFCGGKGQALQVVR
uniref:hypothetical protein n=1 Tax=Neisseria sicca TaxID=490 RepID=UPI001C9992FF